MLDHQCWLQRNRWMNYWSEALQLFQYKYEAGILYVFHRLQHQHALFSTGSFLNRKMTYWWGLHWHRLWSVPSWKILNIRHWTRAVPQGIFTSCWYKYVDDTFVIWPYAKEHLQKFHQHRNTTQIPGSHCKQTDGSLQCVVVLVTKNPGSSEGYSVYMTPTHTDLHLHAKSQQQQQQQRSQKHAMPTALINRVKTVWHRMFE